MKENKARELFRAMADVGDDLIDEAGTVPKRKKMPPWRGAAMAACLCLALLGTAAAANPQAVAEFIQRLTLRVDGGGYHVGGVPMTKYPLSSFSPALLEASQGRDHPVVTRCFSTWDEVRAFVGEEIPLAWPDGGRDWGGDEKFYVYLFHVGLEQLWGIDIGSTSISRQEEVAIQIRTEHWNGSEASSGMGLAEGTAEPVGTHPMPDGSAAEMVRYLGTEEAPHAYSTGYFMRDGILYEATALGNLSTKEELVGRLERLLDSFS